MYSTLLSVESQLRDIEKLSYVMDFFDAVRGQVRQGNSAATGLLITSAGPPDLFESLSELAAVQFQYTGLVVSLYAALENFVEHLLYRAVKYWEERAASFSAVPASIRESHVKVSLALVDQIRRGMPRVSHISDTQVLINLAACLQDSGPFEINALGYTLHSKNIRSSTVHELAVPIGCENVLQLISARQEYIAAVNALEPGIPSRSVFKALDDLAERRNEVSHQGNPEELLSTELLRRYVDVVREFCYGLFAALMITQLVPSLYLYPQLTAIQKVVASRRVLLVDLPPGLTLSNSDFLFAQTRDSKSPYRLARISSIQVEGRAVDFVCDDTLTSRVGIRVDIPCDPKWSFHVISFS